MKLRRRMGIRDAIAYGLGLCACQDHKLLPGIDSDDREIAFRIAHSGDGASTWQVGAWLTYAMDSELNSILIDPPYLQVYSAAVVQGTGEIKLRAAQDHRYAEYFVAVYDDINENRRFDAGERSIGALAGSLMFDGAWQWLDFWRADTEPQPVAAEIPLVRVDQQPVVPTFHFDLLVPEGSNPTDRIAALRFEEYFDALAITADPPRSVDAQLQTSQGRASVHSQFEPATERLSWNIMSWNRGALPHAIEFFVSYRQRDSSTSEVLNAQDVVTGTVCVGNRQLLAIWVQPQELLPHPQEAWVLAMFQLHPGWNLLTCSPLHASKVDAGYGEQYLHPEMVAPLRESERSQIELRPSCDFADDAMNHPTSPPALSTFEVCIPRLHAKRGIPKIPWDDARHDRVRPREF